MFGLYATAADNTLDDLMWCVMDNMVRLCNQVSEEEVERAKTQLKTSVLMQYESFDQVAEDIGRQILTFGQRVPEKDLFAKIDSISHQHVKEAINQVVNDEDHALAAVGPIYELPSYDWIRRRSSSLLF